MRRRHDGVDARLARSSRRSMRFPRRDARSRLPSTGLMELEGEHTQAHQSYAPSASTAAWLKQLPWQSTPGLCVHQLEGRLHAASGDSTAGHD